MITECDASYRDDLVKLTPTLRRFAHALVQGPNPDAADDLVQATLVKALGADKVRRGLRLRLWLVAMFVDQHRTGLREVVSEAKVVALAGGSSGDGRRVGVPQRPNIKAAGLQSMPNDCREVLLLVVLERLTYTEVAEALGVSLNIVIGRLAQARAHLERSASELPTSASLPLDARLAASRLRVVK